MENKDELGWDFTNFYYSGFLLYSQQIFTFSFIEIFHQILVEENDERNIGKDRLREAVESWTERTL